MAVSNFYESIADRQATGTIRQSPTYSRTFMVRVDHPGTSLKEIGSAPGIAYGDPHPDDPTVYVIQIDINAVGDSMMYYGVTYQYGIVASEDVSGGAIAAAQAEASGGGQPVSPPDPLALPVDYWSGSSSLYTVNRQVDAHGNVICNTAGVPIAGGVEHSSTEAQLVLTKHIPIKDFLKVSKLAMSVGSINEDVWPDKGDFATHGSERGHWRVNTVDWSFKSQVSDTDSLAYYEVRITLGYRVGMWYNPDKHVYSSGGNKSIDGWVSPWSPWLASKGYHMIAPIPFEQAGQLGKITVPVQYYDCDNNPIDPPEQDDPNAPCEWPVWEPVAEPMPLDKDGYQVLPNQDTAAIVIADTIHPDKIIEFHTAFGSPNPYDTGNWPNP